MLLPLLAALLVVPQSPLRTFDPYRADNGGALGGVVYFDLDVAVALRVTAFDLNLAATPGSPVGLTVHVRPNGHVGFERSPAAWSLAGSDDGRALAAGIDQSTSIALGTPFVIPPGRHGIALIALGAGHRYTSAAAAPRSFANGELTLHAGAAQNAPFTGTPFSPRVFNGAIHYAPALGLHPAFTATPMRGPAPLSVQFSDRSSTSDPGGVIAWEWDLDGDGNVDSHARHPQFVYQSGGTFPISLTVTDVLHGRRTITGHEPIVVDPVDADFSWSPRSGPAPLTVTFRDVSDGHPTAWSWDFDGDGIVDSQQQHPTFTFVEPGSYTVSLTVTNAVHRDTRRVVDLLQVFAATGHDAGADLLELRFNEPRGAATANAASTDAAPAQANVTGHGGTVPIDDWQGDPGRVGWHGSDAGTGCLRSRSTAPYLRVDSGLPLRIDGSHSLAFWCRTTSGGAPYTYVFGSTTGSPRCYHSGPRLSLRNWGTLEYFVESATDPDALRGWNHWCIVIDDVAGRAQWYLNATADGPSLAFAPGSFALDDAGTLAIGNFGDTDRCFTSGFDLDDFRVWSRALTPAEISAAMRAENPAATPFGPGCPGSDGLPRLAGAGTAPRLGNPAFALRIAQLEPGRPQAIAFGSRARGLDLPLDLSALLGPGCRAEIALDLGAFALPGSREAVVPLPIPNLAVLDGLHLLAQVFVAGSQGAVSPALDIRVGS